MTTLLARLQAALAPDYEVERELASVGMGIVFVGRDVALDRRVAIKIVRPDRATAIAAERFVREARVLAAINHPNLIPVHRAGESAGFFYYVMDYLEAETLAARLGRGPLAPEQAVAMARDVLAALEAVHRRGIVHRDVKPANIFLLEGRAVVGDLGVAKASGSDAPPLTDAGKAMGSPGYMAPEQMAGRDVSPATDLFAVGLVLYESLAGRAWSFETDPSRADWSGVPARLVPALQRALAWAPGDRWPSAAAFRAALDGASDGARRRRLRWAGVAAAAVALVVLAVGVVLRGRHVERTAVLRISVRPFETRPAALRWLGDSLQAALVRDLSGAADFAVAVLPAGAAPGGALVLRGDVDAEAPGVLRLTLRSDGAAARRGRIDLAVSGPARDWARLADSLGYALLLAIWSGEGGHLAAALPVHALPHSRDGLIAWTAAERLFVRAQWDAAYDAYQRALAVDSTCLLCRLRLTDVARWNGRDQDSAATSRYRVALDSFPPHYRRLIEASFAPHDRRLVLLRQATESDPDFGLAWFIDADDIYHRGAFDGYSRAEAYRAMKRATLLWPDFAPAWEHLAWIATAEGDAPAARQALDSLDRLGRGDDPFSASVRALLEVGYRWRFDPPAEAAQYADALLHSPAVGAFARLAAGARYQLTFDAPAGAVWLGARFERLGRPDLVVPGLLAQVYGWEALGRPDSAAAAAARVRGASSEPDVELFLAQLPVALLLADSAPAEAERAAWPRAARALVASAGAGTLDPFVRRRAAWLLALLARRAGDTADARRLRALLDRESGLRPFATLLDADADAAQGRAPEALAHTEPLVGLDSAWQSGDPFFRAVLHLLRAQWHAGLGATALAVRDLRWYENNDLRATGTPAAAPEAAEVDWALGTLARWRIARLFDAGGESAAACAPYAAVRRLWSGGVPEFAARADTAARRLRELRCPVGAA